MTGSTQAIPCIPEKRKLVTLPPAVMDAAFKCNLSRFVVHIAMYIIAICMLRPAAACGLGER